MNPVERTREFIVSEAEGRPPVAPAKIDLPAANQVEGSADSILSGPIKEAVLSWLAHQGKLQRPDVTLFDRLGIAGRFWDPERPRRTPVNLAEEYNLSRTSIYKIANRVAPFFQARRPGPVAGLKQILSSAEPVVAPKVDVQFGLEEEIKRLRIRLILTSLFPGGVTMRPLEDILAEVPGLGRSDSTIWRITNEEGAKASQILQQIDFSDLALPRVLVDIDETFFDGRPILFVVEPISLAICGFHVPADGNRAAITWEPLLLVLQQDQHLDFEGGVADGASAYPGTFKSLLDRDDRLQEDVFHLKRDMRTLERKLENSAYRAIAAEEEAIALDHKESTAKTTAKVAQVQAEMERLVESYDAFAQYRSWVADALEVVDLSSGEIRDRQTNQWLLETAIAAMAQVNHPDVVKMSDSLDKRKPRLLTYLTWIDEQLPPLKTELHLYLHDPDLEKVVLRSVARHWRLEHEVNSNQHLSFRPALAQATEEMDLWVKGDPFLEQWASQLHTMLEMVQRASSAVENINSIFKPLVKRKKHFANSDTAHNFVALFVLWHNMRVFKEGKRKDKSPFEILGIDLGHKDWRSLLGYAPLQ